MAGIAVQAVHVVRRATSGADPQVLRHVMMATVNDTEPALCSQFHAIIAQ